MWPAKTSTRGFMSLSSLSKMLDTPVVLCTLLPHTCTMIIIKRENPHRVHRSSLARYIESPKDLFSRSLVDEFMCVPKKPRARSYYCYYNKVLYNKHKYILL